MRIIRALSMSFTKKEAETSIFGLKQTIKDHLFYLLTFGNTRDSKHWINELSSMFNIIYESSYIKEGKRLKQDRVYDLLFPGSLTTEEGIHAAIRSATLDKTSYKASSDISNGVTTVNIQKLYARLVREVSSKQFTRIDFEHVLRHELLKEFNIKL